jgi:hypothetical protein
MAPAGVLSASRISEVSMTNHGNEPDPDFAETVRGLIAGDFTRLAPLFNAPANGERCPILRWYDEGAFASEPAALAEAFSCACFNGLTDVVEYLLARGVDPNGGMNTGLNAFHWAANRGQLAVVEILICSGAALETRNAYGGTVLGGTVWAAVHEPKPQQLEVIEALLEAGANVDAADFPSGDERIDELLRRYGAGAADK